MISCLVGVFKRGMESLSKTWLEKKHVGYTLCRILQGPVIKRPLYIYSPQAGAKSKLTIERGNNLSIKLPYPLLPAYHRKHTQAKKQVKERNWLQSIHLRTICYTVTVNPFKTVVFNIWKTYVHIHCPHGFWEPYSFGTNFLNKCFLFPSFCFWQVVVNNSHSCCSAGEQYFGVRSSPSSAVSISLLNSESWHFLKYN